ncbi:MAG: permease-like cell division protein FtsX [Candidatus Gastranaerophilales bacterium]|nr:permease-like cell division protein FtsX [Candidatus Gastranaerophilales bacterium]
MSNDSKAKIKKKVKSHIPKDWLGELRIIYRIAMETVNGIQRTGWINVAIITTMAAILTIFGALFRTTLSLSTIVHQLGSALEISVYVKQNSNTDQVIARIKEIPHVEKVKLITKDKAWSDMRKELDVADIENPLPDTLHVKVDKTENIQNVYGSMKNISGIEDYNYAQDIAKKMEVFNNAVNVMTLFVVVIVAVLTIAIINNTIQLVIQSRKKEIEIMRLMGVSNWYIKIPLILQGAIYGFFGALIALIPLNFVQTWLLKVHAFFMIPSPVLAVNTVIMTLFIIAVGFGAGGSLLPIKKYLQV